MLLILSTALAVAMPAAAAIAPPAWAAVPATPVATAVGAPDGVFVFWGPADGSSRMYTVLATVDGVTTGHDVWALSYADRSLRPGQQATYAVVAHDGSNVSAESAPVTARRLSQDWAEPQRARTESLAGPVESDIGDTPFLTASQTFSLDADGKSRFWGVAFDHLSGPGTFELAAAPAPGQVGFAAFCTDPSAADLGSVLVHDVVYGASGTPLELGADFTWRCVGGTNYHLTLRFHSPAPRARVVLEPPVGDYVVAGSPAVVTWRLHNLGDAPATIGAIAASRGLIVDNPCTGIVLNVDAACAILVDMSEPVGAAPGQYGLTLSARVTDQPGAATWHTHFVYVPLQAPKPVINGRLPNMVRLTWGALEGIQPLQGFTIERQRAPDDAWVSVTLAKANDYFWDDHGVTPGTAPSYRLRAMALDGSVSGPSEQLQVSVPSAGLVWPSQLGVEGGSNPEDPGGAWVLSTPDASGSFVGTGVDVSPDRRHLAVTTYAGTTNTNRLLLTDLHGANVQVLDINTFGNALSNRPFFSPDGRRLAFAYGRGYSGAISVLDIDPARRRDLLNQGILYGWSPDGTKVLLANGIDKNGLSLTGLRWVNVADDSYTLIAGTASVPDDDRTLSKQSADVSRTGQIVWVSRAAGGDTLMRTGPAAGSPTTLWAPSGCTLGEPRFDPTGAVLSVETGGTGCSAGAAGGTMTLTVPATGVALASGRLLSTAPAGPQWWVPSSEAPKVVLAAAAVSGPSATATVTATDTDDAVGGLVRVCRLDAGIWQTCGATFTMSKLTAGRHTLTARATDPSGHTSADALVAWMVDATPPTTSLSAISNPLLGNSLRLHWTGTDSGGSSVADYDIRVRYAASGGGFGTFQYPATWQHRSVASLTVGLSQGYTYCFSVRTRDRVGNLGGWSSERCTMAAYDDRALAVSGPYRGTHTAYLFGTYTRTYAAGQTLSRSGISARRVGIVAAVCPTCGAVDVWLAGVKIGTINTARSTTSYRQVLWLPTQTTTRTGSVVLRSTSARRVYVDGLVLQK